MKSDETGHEWTDVLPDTAPTIHRNLDVTVGERTLTTLTRTQLGYWISKLKYSRGGPFMTVSRPDHPEFIQTYRHSDTDYYLEIRSPDSLDELASTTVRDGESVADLIWEWLERKGNRLDALQWERRTI
ncbi:hypothetical protein [Nocardia salmonicida]|uniref:hypothetical protein n=1 Tax=Nocardia salmonicida TaxID=53431 RepID=UPI0007A388FE|nr:hypothetical protein [Nocardia salmonicida]